MAEKKEEKRATPLDLDSILGNTRNRIEKIGIELEGGWQVLPPGAALERDTSVFAEQGNKLAGYHVGELPIGPFMPAALSKFMKKYYPQVVDKSCGMHIHMSFRTLWHYGCLMVPEYPETIVEYLTRWATKENFSKDHCIWGRLKGDSTYCQRKFWPDLQATTKTKDHDRNRQGNRYTQVHYCGRLRTIEVRVLPMMKEVTQAIRALEMVIDITNACMVKLGKRDEKVVGKLEMPNGEIYEEMYEEEIPLTARARKSLNLG